jgi:outer membrane receptor protein involved in Fe transport
MSEYDSSNATGTRKRNALTIAIGVALGGQGAAEAQESGARELEEIIVTAQKRAENLQDLSFSIQAFSEEDMRRQGLYKFEDYARFIPSVSFVSSTPGASKIIFRGVSDSPEAGIAESSAALYLDEQPLTQFGIQVDPRLVDIERIESLSGPQGTLYGDSSQSGTLRIITNKPDPDRFEAFTDMGFRAGSDSSESYDLAAMVNVPLVEGKFAVRLVGFTAEDGGYIDNVAGVSPMLGSRSNADVVGDDINDTEFKGGRVSARWTPDDKWAVTAAFVTQETNAKGRNDYDPLVGDLKTVKFFNETRDDKWWQAALTIERTVGDDMRFLSATSYFDRKIDYLIDRTEYAAYFNVGFCSTYLSYCWSGLSNGSATLIPGVGIDFDNPTPNDQDTIGTNTLNQRNKRFTQEFRLSQDTSRYHWTAGLFFEKKTEEWFYRAFTPEFVSTLAYYYWTGLYEANPSGEPAWWFSHDDVEWKQWAAFGDFTYDFSDHWSGSVGVRYFDQESERVYEVDKRFITAPGVWPDQTPKRTSDKADFLPKASLTYRFDDEKLVYALYSQGFRSGGVNRNRGDISQLVFPPEYEPDYLDNYELGAKTRWLDGSLQVNATVFHMKWDDFQVELIDPSFAEGAPFQVIVGNAGQAEIDGAEISVRTIVGEGLDLGFDVTMLNAELAEDVVITMLVPKGSPLPNVPDYKYSAFAQYNWPVAFVQEGSMFARVQYSYVDDSLSSLEPFPVVPALETPNTPQMTMNGYGIADFSAGLASGRWELQAFVNNFTDERAELYWSTLNHHTFFGRSQLLTNRPREYGLRFYYRWGD